MFWETGATWGGHREDINIVRVDCKREDRRVHREHKAADNTMSAGSLT
jgi:hypothetical protein